MVLKNELVLLSNECCTTATGYKQRVILFDKPVESLNEPIHSVLFRKGSYHILSEFGEYMVIPSHLLDQQTSLCQRLQVSNSNYLALESKLQA